MKSYIILYIVVALFVIAAFGIQSSYLAEDINGWVRQTFDAEMCLIQK